MNRRQKRVVRIAWIFGLIVWIFKPSNLYWNIGGEPSLIWGPRNLLLDGVYYDAWRRETRWDILLGEFAVIVLLTWVLMYLLEGEDVQGEGESQRTTKKSAWWMIEGGGKWIKDIRFLLWFLVGLSVWWLVLVTLVEFAVIVLLTWFVMYKLIGEDVPGEAERKWAASKSALMVEMGWKWVKNNRLVLWLLAGPSLGLAALVWRYL